MSSTNVRIDIPENKPDELIELGDEVLKKHTELGAESPLTKLDMVTFTKNLTDGKAKRAEASRMHKEAEKLNQQAGLNLGIDKTQNVKTPGTVYSTLSSVKEVLLGINKGKEKNLGEWGFKVVITETTRNGKKKSDTK